MRMERRGLVVAILACTLVLAALSGCSPTPAPTPFPSSTTDAPVFESDEEALAAATEAYAAYQAMSDLILSEGGSDPERIRGVAAGIFASSEIEGFEQAAAAGLHSVGSSTFDGISLQSITEGDAKGNVVVIAYLCSDLSRTDIVDANGVSVVSTTRPDRTPFEVRFSHGLEGKLIVMSRTIWEGEGVC